ncbi:MAG: response regulator [Lachnospiraceae bacterium]|nr:response regulator [Lachnospiraceae bacterium]
MDKYENNTAIESKSEKFLLTIVSIYQLCICIMSLRHEWEVWISFFIMGITGINWVVVLEKYRNLRFRADICTIMAFTSTILCGVESGNFIEMLPIMITLAVVTGIYGILDTAIIAILFTSFHCIYFYFTQYGLNLSALDENSHFIMQILNAILAEILVAFWILERKGRRIRFGKIIEELQNAERRKDDFLANVSHEIRTPVNTICGLSEVLMKERDSEKIQEYLEYIQAAGYNLMTVVSDILDFSELQSGKTQIIKETYNLTSSLNDVISMVMEKLNNKNIALVVKCDAEIPCGLVGDIKKVQRVVMNLLDNAIKFTENGGVVLSIDYREEEYGINLIITIKDTGIGMTEESLVNLFDSYNQVDASRRRTQGGVGLGIAISQALVKAMGGILTVSSKFGKGSEIKIVIPQEVFDERPIIYVRNKEKIRVGVYVNMERYEIVDIRDEYLGNIQSMLEQISVRHTIWQDLEEVKSGVEKEGCTHVFLGLEEYLEDMCYFDQLAEKIRVSVVLLRSQEKQVRNPKIIHIYKPFYILPLVSVLHGSLEPRNTKGYVTSDPFIAPEAHVLVVDDNIMNITVIEKLLQKYEIKVTRASSGQMALEKIEDQCYDFVFMDHMMPEMDGIEALHAIRKKNGMYYKSVPVIALTANAVAGAREMFIEEGFSDFLEKPVMVSELERVLKRTLLKEKIQIIKIEDEEITEENMQIWEGEKEEKNNNYNFKQECPQAGAVDGTVDDTKEMKDNNKKENIWNGNKLETINIMQGNKEVKKKEVQKEPEQSQELRIGDLDTKSGFLYCGGKEGYISILQLHCENAGKTREQIISLYEEENWKEYTISVHAIKSFMLSIGAVALSEMAKKLEFAGKANDIDYIKGNHNTMLATYDQVTKEIMEHPLFKQQQEEPKVEEDKKQELPGMEVDTFNRLMTELEDAMYDLEEQLMKDLLDELEQYAYLGNPLKEVLKPVRRKVEMSDYMSGAEYVAKLKQQLNQ